MRDIGIAVQRLLAADCSRQPTRAGAFPTNPKSAIHNPKPLSSLKITRSINATRKLCGAAAGPIVLVPTMGALHRGHGALIARARKLAGARGFVVVSVFVNPTQFGPKEDFARYPRPFRKDAKLCAELGVDLIFNPEPETMYARDFSTFVDERSVALPLCGASRPGHFTGVCTVVLKLFQIVQPNSAVFGRKDFQQCAVLQRMVRDLNVPVRLVFAETVREPDGLALSSRNAYLSPEERQQATVLRRALLSVRAAFRAGEKNTARLLERARKSIGTAPLARLDYLEIADGESLASLGTAKRDAVVAGALFVGRTRLIDNLQLR
jgi:pantoate--beta-alanine ligase